jgi:hypothetical protein
MMIAKVKKMMIVAGLTVALGIGAVLFVIGYRVFKNEGSVATSDVTAMLPKGARVTATSVAADRLLVTIDVGGMTEIRTFDAKTLKPAGRLRFATEP